MVKPAKPGWPYLEGTLFVALTALVNAGLFPESPAFKGAPFSLLWVPILLIAGRYGTAPALFTSFLCSAYYFLRVSLENFFLGDVELSVEDKVMVFSFIFVGVFMGQMYDRIMNQLITLSHAHEDLKEQHENLQQHYKALENANVELEKRVVGRYTTLSSLYEMARGLESLDENHLYKGVLDLIHRFLHAEKMSFFYAANGTDWQLVEVFGFQAAEKDRIAAALPANPLFIHALKAEGVVSFRQGFEEQAQNADESRILLASPVVLLTNNRRVGLIFIHALPFFNLNTSSLRILSIICDWTARAFEKSQAFADLKTRELDDKLTGGIHLLIFQDPGG
jgi:hypothetical protein